MRRITVFDPQVIGAAIKGMAVDLQHVETILVYVAPEQVAFVAPATLLTAALPALPDTVAEVALANGVSFYAPVLGTLLAQLRVGGL